MLNPSQDHDFSMTESNLSSTKKPNLQNAISFQPLGPFIDTTWQEKILVVESVPQRPLEDTQTHERNNSAEFEISSFNIPRHEQYTIEPQAQVGSQALTLANSHGILDDGSSLRHLRSSMRNLISRVQKLDARNAKYDENSPQDNFPQNSPIDSTLRRKLTDVLIHPVTEPLVLFLILVHTILLLVYTSVSVFTHPQLQKNTRIDYSILAIFIMYTFEIMARIYVSGLIFSRRQSGATKTQRSIRRFWGKKKKTFFDPHLLPSADDDVATGRTREIDGLLLNSDLRSRSMDERLEKLPNTVKDQRRFQLHRAAFLRHTFNRVDFVSVISFWIAFAVRLSGSGFPDTWRVFWMLSSLRIIRLLALTTGTLINLRALKKVSPLLLRILLLICFFMIIFAVIGVQFFKSSLKRTCVLIDTVDMHSNYTSGQYCGGYLDHANQKRPWLMANGENGASRAFGYICPLGLLCVEGQNPFNGTMSFDDFPHALEQVFVLMTTNTFSDVMYELTMSNSLAAAIYFVAGIIVLWFSLANQFTAVIIHALSIVSNESKISAFIEDRYDSQKTRTSLLQDISIKHRLYQKTHWIWLIIIAYGLLAQCLRTSHMSTSAQRFVDLSETVVTGILFLEILIRIRILRWKIFKGTSNKIDLLLASVTLIMQIPKIHNSREPYLWLTIFQILRIYRLVLALPFTKHFISTAFNNISGLRNILLLTFLTTWIFALMASQLFRGSIPEYKQNLERIDVNFSTIYNSFFGLYQFISGKDWTNILYQVTASQAKGTAWAGAIFCILWAAIIFFSIRNMLIAYIQEGTEGSRDENRVQQVRKYLDQTLHPKQIKPTISSIFKISAKPPGTDDAAGIGSELNIYIPIPQEDHDSFDILDPIYENKSPDPIQTYWGDYPVETPSFFEPLRTYLTRFLGWRKDPFHSPLVLAPDTSLRSAVEQRNKERADYLKTYPFVNRSLFAFMPHSYVRRFCQRIVEPSSNERFQGVKPSIPMYYTFWMFTFAITCTMVITTCIATPLYQKEYFEKHGFSFGAWFIVLDILYPTLFTIESIIKVIADGFYFTPNAYIRSPWGFIECVVLASLWINLVAILHYQDSVPRAFGAIKALRAVRLLEAIEGVGSAFYSSLVGGKWRLISAIFVSGTFMIAFALYALNLFTGQTMYCNDTNSTIIFLADCAGEYINDSFGFDMLAPRNVANPYYNFDNFGNSLFIIFQLASLESWVDVMWNTMNIAGPGLQPRHLASQWHSIFFLVFNIACVVFIVSLFEAVVIRNYTESTGVAYLTSEQRSWLELKKLVLETSDLKQTPKRLEKSKWRQWCFQQSSETAGIWYWIMLTTLLFHLLLLCLEFYPSPIAWDRTRTSIFLILMLVYIVNIIIRIVGLTWSKFRRRGWDIYSLFSVSGTIITTGFVFADFNQQHLPSTISSQVQGLFLVSIALMLIPMLSPLEKIFEAALSSFISIIKFLVAWFVLFLIFAIATTQCFSLTKFNLNENTNANFRDVPKAFLLLFRMSFGNGWNRIMEDFATMNPPKCIDSVRFLDGDCGSSGWARGLFIAWNIINKYMIVNLIVAVVCNSLSEMFYRSTGRSVINLDELRRFRETWAKYDPQLTGYINKDDVSRLLGGLTGGFAMKIYDGDFTIRRIIEDCKVATTNERFQASLRNFKTTVELDLDLLNQRISDLAIEDIRKRRLRLNIVFEEIMQTLNADNNIYIKDILMILVHHNFSDSKSLGLAEFLQRRSHLQNVEKAVQKKMVLGLFSQLYWRRYLRKEIRARQKARTVTQLRRDVPTIFVKGNDI